MSSFELHIDYVSPATEAVALQVSLRFLRLWMVAIEIKLGQGHHTLMAWVE